MIHLRHGFSRASLKTLWMLASAVIALGAAVLAARSGNADFDAWFWMPVVWSAVMLAGLLLGLARHGLPGQDVPTPTASGDPTRDLTAEVNRWFGADDLPSWQRLTTALATISTAVVGLTIVMLTGEVFLGMPLSWWVIAMVILAGIGAFELLKILRTQEG